MGLVAEFEMYCDALPLTGVAAAVPEATVVLQLQFNHGPRPMFIVTVTGGPKREFEAALDTAPDVADWTLVGVAGETRKYQAWPGLSLDEQLGDHIDDLSELEALARADAVIERIEVQTNGWKQAGWFADRDEFRAFSSFWRRNADFRLLRLTRGGEPESPGNGMTDRQQEALRIAYERGYFDIPRRTSLEDIAAELGVSPSSASERLRRAQTRLVEETVAPTWPPLPD
ncbi:helix-turn-helix domain-containing protein [Haloferax sp. S1W]|uniref:helix-turn-helix domain-containing protein n=1 Tax=Haloferax sp. S1W TaxID=3377110 RepID=UPI0037C68548